MLRSTVLRFITAPFQAMSVACLYVFLFAFVVKIIKTYLEKPDVSSFSPFIAGAGLALAWGIYQTLKSPNPEIEELRKEIKTLKNIVLKLPR